MLGKKVGAKLDYQNSDNDFYPMKHIAQCCLHNHLNNLVTP